MRKPALTFLFLLGLASSALAQATSWPPPAGAVAFLCVFNTAFPTMTNGQVGFAQCDSSGRVAIAPAGNTTPSAVKITDGTNGPVAVKPPSTPALATDPALVVQLAPNSPGIGLDPCSYAQKSSVPISVASATTTSLVNISASTVIYVCGFAMTIAPSATAADTAKFQYGTGATCGTGTTDLTGTFGNGDLTSAAPVVPVTYGNGFGTVFATIAAQRLCILTAGTAVSVQGVLTYVQQ